MKSSNTKRELMKKKFMKIPSFGPLEAIPCPNCQTSEFDTVATQSIFGEDFKIVRCKKCGLIHTNPRPTKEWKKRFYDPEYNGYIEEKGRDFVYLPSPKREPANHMILNFICNQFNPRKARVIDIGCATGDFVKIAEDYGFEAFGCDFSKAALCYGYQKYQLKLVQGAAESLPLADETFDFVTMLHLIEHFPNPFSAIKEAKRILRKGGIFIVETPNYLTYYYIQRYLSFLIPIYCKITGRYDLPWFPFDHLFHWTHKTLIGALSQEGFDYIQLINIKNYRAEMPLDRPVSLVFKLYSKLTHIIFRWLGDSFDYRPILMVMAVKK